MANEFQHKDPGGELTQAEFIATDGHSFDSQATGDILYASSTTVLTRLGKGADGTVLELASGLPAWTASPTIGSTSWANATHAHAAANSGGTIAITSTTGTLAVGNGGTGITSLATGVATFLGTSSSANLRAALTDETGTGLAVFNGSPSLTTPTIGSFANSAHDHADAAGGAAVVSAAADASGIVELATTAETTTGTDAARSVTPDGLAGSVHGEKVIQMVVVDFATALTTGNGKFYFHVPSTLNGMNIVDVHAEVISAPAGSTIIIDLYNLTQTADILSTNLTIDAGETGSDTAAAAAAISASEDDLATNDVVAVDIDQIGSSTAGSGLIVTLICRLP